MKKSKMKKSKNPFIPTNVGIPGLFGGGKMKKEKDEPAEIELEVKKKKK